VNTGRVRGIHFLGDGEISVDQHPIPIANGTQVVVKIGAAGICGTDRHNLMGKGQKTIPGHENAGVIVDIDKPSWLRRGDRVAINCHITCGACEHCLRGDLYFCEQLVVPGEDIDGGFAEYLAVPERICMPLPADITIEQGALMVDVLGTAFRAYKRANLIPGEQIGIWGAGPIGFEVALVAKAMGSRIAVFEPNSYRAGMIKKKIQPELVLDPDDSDSETELAEWTEGKGVVAAFECVGNENAAQQAIRSLKKRGKLIIVGVSHQLCIDPWNMIQKELSIIATRNFNTHAFSEMITLIRNGLKPEGVITHRFGFSNAQAAFTTFLSGDCGKIIFIDMDKNN